MTRLAAPRAQARSSVGSMTICTSFDQTVEDVLRIAASIGLQAIVARDHAFATDHDHRGQSMLITVASATPNYSPLRANAARQIASPASAADHAMLASD